MNRSDRRTPPPPGCSTSRTSTRHRPHGHGPPSARSGIDPLPDLGPRERRRAGSESTPSLDTGPARATAAVRTEAMRCSSAATRVMRRPYDRRSARRHGTRPHRPRPDGNLRRRRANRPLHHARSRREAAATVRSRPLRRAPALRTPSVRPAGSACGRWVGSAFERVPGAAFAGSPVEATACPGRRPSSSRGPVSTHPISMERPRAGRPPSPSIRPAHRACLPSLRGASRRPCREPRPRLGPRPGRGHRGRPPGAPIAQEATAASPIGFVSTRLRSTRSHRGAGLSELGFEKPATLREGARPCRRTSTRPVGRGLPDQSAANAYCPNSDRPHPPVKLESHGAARRYNGSQAVATSLPAP